MKGLNLMRSIILLGLSTICWNFATAQTVEAKPISISEMECIYIKGEWRVLFNNSKRDIILNREIYTSLFEFYGGDQEFSCKLPSAKSASLDMELAISSSQGGPFLLSVYLNGSSIISEKVFPGKVTQIQQSLTGRSDTPYQVGGRRTLTFETTCLSASGCGTIRLLKGNLNVISNPGGK